MMWLISICMLVSVHFVEPARILGVFPMPSISHQYVFRALTKELVKQGHELVVITANPTAENVTNVKEISVGLSYEVMGKLIEEGRHKMKRGVVIDIDAMVAKDAHQGRIFLISGLFKNPDVQKLINDKNQKFDLVIAEAFLSVPLMFAKIFNAPAIQISSLYGLPENYETMGAVSRHPLLYPNIFRNTFRDLSIVDKIREFYYEVELWRVKRRSEELENSLLKSHFGADAPTVTELEDRVQLLFVNSHPMFDNNRPVPPSVVYLGGIHMQPIKDLPQDLKSYLDNSKRGVVYVSLGSNVRTGLMDKDLLEIFVNAFEELPYDVLWKFDGDLPNAPKNLRLQKWFPQRDLLTHPNVKAFVTQGGLQSTDEAIDAAVPVVGIPTMGDQWYNVDKYVKFGIGVQLDALTMSPKDIVDAVEKVIKDSSYKENMKRLRSLINDQPEKPLDRAVWWTEYVLRHGNANHLRSPAANMSWSEYYMSDIITVVAISLSILVIFVIFLLCNLVRLVCRCFSKKRKVKIN